MAGRIKRDDIDGLRSQADIAAIVADHTQLKRAGSRMKGLCPFHSERTPSFTVDPTKGLWHCFGCGEGGDVYDFLQRVQGLSFTEAVEQLARRTGFTLHYEDLTPGQRRALGERSRLVEINQVALERFQTWLLDEEGTPAREYLKARGFGRVDADKFKLGYAPNEWERLSRDLQSRGYRPDELVKVGLVARNDRGGIRDRFRGRVIFPVFDATGDPIGFGGRLLPGLDHGNFDPPKYYNSPETPLYRKTRVLYGLSQARVEMAATGEVLVCEGYTDVMALHQAGFANAVATCGTAVGAEHFRVLSRYVTRIVLAFDGDAAGAKAAETAWEHACEVEREAGGPGTSLAFSVRVLMLPDDADPAEYVHDDGVDALRAQVVAASPVIPFLIRRHLAQADLSTEVGRTAALRDVVTLLGQEPDADLRRAYARTEVAEPLSVSDEWVQQTARRLGVTLDRHAGAAVRAVRRTDRGKLVTATRERAVTERAVLRVALQRPEWLTDGWDELVADDFQHPRARTVFEAIGSAGGPGVTLDVVMDAAADDDDRALLRAMALEESDPPDTPAGHAQHVGDLLADRVDTELAGVRQELGRVNPTTDPARFRDLNRRVFLLEQRRRGLRTVDPVSGPPSA